MSHNIAEEIRIAREMEVELTASFGSGSGSRAANSNARGRQGGRTAHRGSTTRLRNRIAGAQGQNRGRGSRARRQALNDLATQARGNSRGNINRRQSRSIASQISDIVRQIRQLGG